MPGSELGSPMFSAALARNVQTAPPDFPITKECLLFLVEILSQCSPAPPCLTPPRPFTYFEHGVKNFIFKEMETFLCKKNFHQWKNIFLRKILTF